MSVTLTPQVEALIQQKIEGGSYNTASEVIEEAIKLLDARDQRVRQIRDSIEEGLASIDRGEGIELTPELLTRRGRQAGERARRGEQPHPDVCP